MCEDSEYFDKQSMECVTCESRTENCYECDVDGECEACELNYQLGYFLGDVICESPEIPLCVEYNSNMKQTCDRCIVGSVLRNDKQECVSCHEHVPGCVDCTINYKGEFQRCTTCV